MQRNPPIYYIIHPKDTLLKTLENYPASGMAESSIWTRDEGGYTRASFDDWLKMVKIVFIMKLVERKYLFESKNIAPDSQRLLHELLGQPPYSIEIFDKWWTLERLARGSEDFVDILKNVSIPTLNAMNRTGQHFIDDWLAHILKMKEDGQL